VKRHKQEREEDQQKAKLDPKERRMRTTNLPSQLPYLPGNTYADPTITRYHKTQLFGVKQGTVCGKSQNSNFPPKIAPCNGCSLFQTNYEKFAKVASKLIYSLFVGCLTLCDVCMCVIVEKNVYLKENVDQDLLKSMREGAP